MSGESKIDSARQRERAEALREILAVNVLVLTAPLERIRDRT
jgi:hypothetical protein